MQNFVEQMQGMFKSGEITVSNYKPGQLMESGEYRKIVGSLAQKAGMEPLETIERQAYGNYKSIRYHVYPNGLIVMEFQYIGSDDQIHHEIVQEVPDELADGVKFSVFDRSVGGIVKGSEKAVGEIIEGFIAFGNFMDRNFNPKSDQPMDIKIFAKKLADDPKSTLAGIGRKAIDMPKYVWEGITNAWKRDVLKGDATSRAEFFTYAFVTIGLGVVADKGASKVGTLAKTGGQASKAKNVKTGVAPSMNLMPEPVLVPAGAAPRNTIPYNVMHNLLSKIEQVTKEVYGEKKGIGNKGIDNAKDITKLTVDDIPTAKSGNFSKFFNSLTSSELDELWKDKKIRKKIERQLREPGGLHEWHLVSRAPQFKYWNIGAEEIKDLRTAISDVKFVNPNGVHGGLGSTKAHNELLAIIDTSSDYNTFVRRLNNWANYRLKGGVSSLPQGLRLKD